jgi:HSP20 family protein
MTKEIQKPVVRQELATEFDRDFEPLHDRFFDLLGLPTFGFPFLDAAEHDHFRPARADVADTGAAYRIVMDVPGIPKENLDIRVRGSLVEVRGESSKTTEETGAEYVHRERTYAGYQRSFELPEPVVAAKATAKVTDGVLELELPKQTPTPAAPEVQVPVQ